ncbi:hypothetical protein [Erythrobacter sp. Alg231-14]|uniref:hypothetical protein n=1 Tax=Erythrobacter sp. Alg231-14 TaxID=1922225 RepID=UPI00307B2084
MSKRIGVSAAAIIASPLDTALVSPLAGRSQLPPWLACNAGKGTAVAGTAGGGAEEGEGGGEEVTQAMMRWRSRYVNALGPYFCGFRPRFGTGLDDISE